MEGLGQHPEEVDRLPGRDRGQREERVLLVAAEDVAGHVLGGRHVLERRVGEDLAGRFGLCDLEEETVLQLRVDLEGVPEADLPVLEAGVLREALVDELGGEDRRGLLDGVGGRQVVVLARVDDDPGDGVDPAGKVLVDERAQRIDVAEDDAVERVVQHHVQPLERSHRGDLGHAEPRAVVHEADVAADLRLDRVEGGAHEAEVLLGRVGAAEPRASWPRRGRGRAATGRSSG